MVKDNFYLAIKNIRERKSRVFLTLLGIAIGIMAIVSLMAIGEGMNSAVTGELSSLSDMIIVTSSDISIGATGAGTTGGTGEYFNDRDIDDISRINGIRTMSSMLFSKIIVEYNNENQIVSALGIEPKSMSNIFGIDFLGLESGSFMDENDQNKCIIGYNIAHEYFDTEITVGNKIEINNKNFVVNGIYNKQGEGMSTETDDYIHLTLRDFKRITGQENISGIMIRVYNVDNVEYVAEEIEYLIGENHGDEDFANAITMTSIIESIQNVLSIIQAVLIAIAGIALIVASIGIMNTMLTSVLERTHEIGIMKAIGARNSDILYIFLMEGLLISLIGGIIGIMLGIIGSYAFSFLTSGFMGPAPSISPVISIVSIILAVGVSMFVGIISSIYPARKAAKMSPIEAVRYE